MTSTRSRSFACLLAAALATTSLVNVALAQEYSPADLAQARELLNQGLSLRDKGDAAGALEKLRGAHALVDTPITCVELGRTYLLLGKLVEARETFLSVARIAPQPQETAHSRAARSESLQLAADLRPRIPSLLVRIKGVRPETVAVTVDGAAVPSEALGAPRLLDPGTHQVLARSNGATVAENKVELREGEAREIELEVAPGSVVAPPPPPPEPKSGSSLPSVPLDTTAHRSPSRALEWALIVGGVLVGAGGGTLMAVEVGKASDARNDHDKTAYDSATSLWTVGLVGGLVGVAAVASGGILFAATGHGGEPASAQSSSAGPELWVGAGPGRVSLGGRW